VRAVVERQADGVAHRHPAGDPERRCDGRRVRGGGRQRPRRGGQRPQRQAAAEQGVLRQLRPHQVHPAPSTAAGRPDASYAARPSMPSPKNRILLALDPRVPETTLEVHSLLNEARPINQDRVHDLLAELEAERLAEHDARGWRLTVAGVMARQRVRTHR
jgi:hypothetical protein